MSKPIVAIVGRPNVGKSTLFNIFADSRISIVEDTPGVTRDRLYADAEWLDRKFTMVDTGGIEMQNTDSIAVSIRQQAEVAIREADVILFVCDARTGITNDDLEVAKMLRQSRKPVVLAVNKADTPKQEAEAYEFYNLGIGEPYLISASNRLNLGDLLDAVVEKFPPEGEDEDDSEDVIKVAIIGRPNVGKSSIFNDIIGQTRSIVSDVAGTTRDAIDVPVEKDGQTFLFIDTAGMRRKGKIDEPIEKYSIIRTLRAVDRSDVVLLVLNAVEGITDQDKKIAGYAHEAGKGIVIVVNKWDLYPDKTVMSTEEFTKNIRHELIFMPYANVVYVSALTQQDQPAAGNDQRCGRSQCHADRYQCAEPGGDRRCGHEPASYGKGQAAEDPLHYPSKGEASDFRDFLQRTGNHAFLLSEVSGKPAPGSFWLQGDPHQHHRPGQE